MTHAACPELDVLFAELAEGQGPALEHAKGCEHCADILEEHRQLEKDLFRLADPLPPPDFVHLVMARVAAQPVPVRSEIKVGLTILVVTFGLFVASLIGADFHLGTLGVQLASTMVFLRELAIGLGSGVQALWQTAAIPMVVSLTVLLLLSLLGLKRLTPTPLAEMKVG